MVTISAARTFAPLLVLVDRQGEMESLLASASKFPTNSAKSTVGDSERTSSAASRRGQHRAL
ncbi:hypothetical protein M413DRAFT_443709 [Hebeloma cylindrosporum]|uniref:Uncharacterized protein n=1 Tax=Hebeloma cylindrosporum TaxID=76867 RepID=A0A0C3CI53_HEBCY|nr:hypothetical protein M413DRAFT_443709 [Hebeloma cylindrosporum h7]